MCTRRKFQWNHANKFTDQFSVLFWDKSSMLYRSLPLVRPLLRLLLLLVAVMTLFLLSSNLCSETDTWITPSITVTLSRPQPVMISFSRVLFWRAFWRMRPIAPISPSPSATSLVFFPFFAPWWSESTAAVSLRFLSPSENIRRTKWQT